ncbi:MAG: glycogen/starch synthase [Candidatus Woesearchaeota archaeon]
MVFFFEASWEVCNKVGGINTVLKTKARHMKKKYSNYILFGPYFKENAEVVFEEKKAPEKIQLVIDKLKEEGIICHYGEWQVNSYPKTILIEFDSLKPKINDLKAKFWEEFKVDSLNSSWDFEEPMLWSTAVAKFIEDFKSLNKNEKVILHAHEWLSGFSILHVKSSKEKIATVFTTHATILGRTLSAHKERVYNILDQINPDQKAKEFNISEKHTVEKASAHSADVFTTVSEITGLEATHFLGRKPEVLVLNGIDTKSHPTFEETSIEHSENREKIREFCKYFFFPYHSFNLEHTLFFFTAARYEYHNKGLDYFIESLSELNQKLKRENSKRNIVAFFFIPAGHNGIRRDLLEHKTRFTQIKNFVNQRFDKIMNLIVNDIITEKEFTKKNLLPKEIIQMRKKLVNSFRDMGNPPLSTHYINDDNDQIINAFQKYKLLNKKEDKVKVVFYPVYLDGTDGLLDLAYEDTISGMHLGVFPSYYEPWGYTPPESMALSCPAITSDLSGYGAFMKKNIKGLKNPGLYILNRRNKGHNQIKNQFTKLLYDYAMNDRHKRVYNKINAKALVDKVSWDHLSKNYFDAHNLALDKTYNN